MAEVRIRPKKEGKIYKGGSVGSKLYDQTAGDTEFGEFSGPHVPMWSRRLAEGDDTVLVDGIKGTVSPGLKVPSFHNLIFTSF